ncbi:hypothetical protein [Streptomyces sp. NPDC088115]|uniref:hypothetical protein n=1 Tax=Streptomyces sp. NPDC088115 TaxID=3365824 RepID=UPI00380FC107
MSADTAPAAIPGPDEPTGTTPAPGPVTGLLASMVAPVEPARPTFDLTPATAHGDTQEEGADLPSGGISSASFHDEDGASTTTGDSSTTTSGKAQTGIWRAWLIAGATRWGKGGGTANKRYDMHKARAQARKVTETRTVTVNRSPAGPAGGARGSNAAGATSGKGLGGKPGQDGGGAKGPRNTGPAAKNDSRGPGRSENNKTSPPNRNAKGGGGGGAGSGASGGGSGAGGTKNGPEPKQQKPGKTDTGPQPSKTNGTDQKPGKGGGGAAGGSAGPKGSAGSSGKDGTTPKTPTPAKGTAAGPGTKTGPDTPKREKTSLVKGDKTAKADKDSTKTDPKSGEKTDKKTASGKDTPVPGDGEKGVATAIDGTKNPFSTKESRETGYRDGSRLARATAHGKAYIDGVKDGWTDTTEAAERQKAQLDETHALRKQQLAQEREQQMTTASPEQPQPIDVIGIDDKNVYLGAGAERESLTRGEVRSLKAFERRLDAKIAVLLKAAEQARTLQAHAAEQAKEATQLLESARGSKAGEKVIGSLVRTQEGTASQAKKAEELYTRAIRGSEQCSAVLTNVKTRYGALYAAVVNSPETKPAEMAFYRDGVLTNV